MTEMAWKKLANEISKMFGAPVTVKEKSETHATLSPLEEAGSSLVIIIGSQQQAKQHHSIAAREVAFTDYLRQRQPDPQNLGYYLSFMLSDQSYRWN